MVEILTESLEESDKRTVYDLKIRERINKLSVRLSSIIQSMYAPMCVIRLLLDFYSCLIWINLTFCKFAKNIFRSCDQLVEKCFLINLVDFWPYLIIIIIDVWGVYSKKIFFIVLWLDNNLIVLFEGRTKLNQTNLASRDFFLNTPWYWITNKNHLIHKKPTYSCIVSFQVSIYY